MSDERGQYVLPDGSTILHANRNETDFVYREIFVEHCYFRHGIAVESGDCVFDVGANIGLFSLYLSKLVPDLKIFAFEPLPPIFRLLDENRRLCGMHGMRALPFGLSDRDGSAAFTFYPRNSIMSGRYADSGEDRGMVKSYLRQQLSKEQIAGGPPDALLESIAARSLVGERFDCKLQTLSGFIRENDIARIDLLKVDVEKSELDVLRGVAESDWPRIRQVVAEVYDGDGRLAQILELLRVHGFDFSVEQDTCLSGSPVYMVYARRNA